MNDAIKDLKDNLFLKNTNQIENPQRTVLTFPKYEASALYMPSANRTQEVVSIKIVSIFPNNPSQERPTTQGVLLLTDASTGEHICLMNASYLTRLRTGALSGIATSKFSRLNSSVLGVIGTGAMAFEQVLGVLQVREIKKIMLYNKTRKKAEEFEERLIDFGVMLDISIEHNVDELVETADIICCSTRSNDPVFNGKLLKPGTHINGIGSYLPSMREVDLETVHRSSKIIVDDLEGVKEEEGELIFANQVSDWSFSDVFAELSDTLINDELQRDSSEEITFFKSVGAAYFDLIVALGVYRKAKEEGVGIEVIL